MRLNEDDLYRVVSRIPKAVRKIMKDGTVFLGGGFIRDVICGDKPSDIDLFGPSKEVLQLASKSIKDTFKRSREHKTDNAITLLAGGMLPIQFITRWLYSNPEAIINSFDFTIAQAVVYVDKPGDKPAWVSITSDSFYADLAAKRLRYTRPERDEDAGGSMLRVVKFLRRGYSISPEDLGGVITRLLNGIEMNSWLADSEDIMAKESLVVGLLREVDPLYVLDGMEFRKDVRELKKELTTNDASLGQFKKMLEDSL